MKIENYQILQELLSNLRQECDEVDRQLDSNLMKVQEIDCFTNYLLKTEDSDFKIFSPRNTETLYQAEFSQEKEKKVYYNKKIEYLEHRKKELSLRIENLEKVLREECCRNYSALRVQEEERQRIASDLHDISLQNLSHLFHKIELSSLYIEKDPLRAKLELSVVSKNLKDIIDEIREIIFNLRPMSFDDLGMKAALERLVDVFNKNKLYDMDVDIDDVSCENNMVLVSIYRVIKECFNNIMKHANATKVYFHCKIINDNCHIVIMDNGKGYIKEEVLQKEDKHFGLSLMQERVEMICGNIEMQSDENGTRIEISVPLK